VLFLIQVKVVCVTSKAGVGFDNGRDDDVVNISMFHPLDRLTNMVEIFPSKISQVCLMMSHN